MEGKRAWARSNKICDSFRTFEIHSESCCVYQHVLTTGNTPLRSLRRTQSTKFERNHEYDAPDRTRNERMEKTNEEMLMQRSWFVDDEVFELHLLQINNK